MQKNQTGYLTFGAIVIALFVFLLATLLYIPFVVLIIGFLLPLPIAWYASKFERKQAIFVTTIAIVISLAIGGIIGFIFGLLLASLGFIIGDSIRSKKSKIYMLMTSWIFLLLTLALLYIISILVFNINVLEKFLEGIEIYYEQVGSIMTSVGQLPENYDEIVRQSLLLIEVTMPFYFMAMVFLAAFMYLVINLALLKKLKLDVPRFSKFMDYRLPKAVLWYYLIVSIFSLIMEFEIGTFGYLILVNAALVLRTLLFLQGVSLIHYYFFVKGWPKWSAILATILAVPLYSFTIILGVLDLGFNMRNFLRDRYKK